MLRCYITDRMRFAGDDADRRQRVLACIGRAMESGVDFVQLREKDLSANSLEQFALQVRQLLGTREPAQRPKLLIHHRTDIALAIGAEGVHLPSRSSGALSAADVRTLWMRSSQRPPVISVSCHTEEDVALAESQGADFVLFGPVFEKSGVAAIDGLTRLRRVCVAHPRLPILALGGVNAQNTPDCLRAGAAGIAAIRLFQE